MMEFYSERLYKAKKEHCCECCGTKIKIGETYDFQAGKFDNEFFTRHLHLRCAEFLNQYVQETAEDEFDWEEVYSHFYETRCEKCERYSLESDECSEEHDIFNCPYLTKEFGPIVE